MTPRLTGKVAILTGATSGIGEATAQRLATEGCALILTGRSAERGEALAADLDATFLGADLRTPDTPARLVQAAIDRYQRLDILINNAAIDHTGDLLTTLINEIQPLFETNVFATIRMLQAAGRTMAARDSGAIVNVTSRLASIGVPTMGYYGASKGALLALTRAAAVELAPKGIRVNAVAPGMTATPLYQAWLHEQPDPRTAEQTVVAHIPQRRVARADDVAAAIAYLASDDAAHVTGASLPVDGGYTAG